MPARERSEPMVAAHGSGRRVAIVHDRFTEIGGAEAVVTELGRLWPEATVFSALVDPSAVPKGLAGHRIEASAAQRLYRGGRTYAHLLPLLPLALARLPLDGFDLVITSHYAFANRVRPPAGVPVVSYTYTPARWIWRKSMRDLEIGGPFGRAALGAFAATQRGPDAAAARRCRAIVADSNSVKDRIRDWWGRDATVVPPPVDIEGFTPDPSASRDDFFLVAGRLVPYKRAEVAAAAATRAGVRLVVAGEGRWRRAVEQVAGPRVELVGAVDDDTLRNLFRTCRALVFPGEEDFGLVPVEAQACGAPVLALGVGGALDTVVPGTTGILYPPGGDEVETLAAAMRAFDPDAFDPVAIRRHAERFAPQRFRDEMREVVARALDS